MSDRVKAPHGSPVSEVILRKCLGKKNNMWSSRITDLQYLYDFTEGPFVLQYTVNGGNKVRECRRWRNTWTVFTTSANWISLRLCRIISLNRENSLPTSVTFYMMWNHQHSHLNGHITKRCSNHKKCWAPQNWRCPGEFLICAAFEILVCLIASYKLNLK